MTSLATRPVTDPALEDQLRGIDLLCSLDDEAAAALMAYAQRRRLERAETIFAAGDVADGLYVVLAGKVKLTRYAPGAPRRLLDLVGPGETFGELAVIDSSPRTSTAASLVGGTEVAYWGAEDVAAWLLAHPAAASRFLGVLARRLRRASDEVADYMFLDVGARVARALLGLGRRFGTTTPAGVVIRHDLTQLELAQLTGASRETVNKTLCEYVSRDWITLEHLVVVIRRPDLLARRAR